MNKTMQKYARLFSLVLAAGILVFGLMPITAFSQGRIVIGRILKPVISMTPIISSRKPTPKRSTPFM